MKKLPYKIKAALDHDPTILQIVMLWPSLKRPNKYNEREDNDDVGKGGRNRKEKREKGKKGSHTLYKRRERRGAPCLPKEKRNDRAFWKNGCITHASLHMLSYTAAAHVVRC